MLMLRVPMCAAMLLLVTPALAHPARTAPEQAGPHAMRCSDMHAAMHDQMKGTARDAPKTADSRPGMMEGGNRSAMKCMREDSSKAPSAHDDAQAPHSHEHSDAPPK